MPAVHKVAVMSVYAMLALIAHRPASELFSVEQDLIDTRNGFRETRRVFMQKAFDDYRGDQLCRRLR